MQILLGMDSFLARQGGESRFPPGSHIGLRDGAMLECGRMGFGAVPMSSSLLSALGKAQPEGFAPSIESRAAVCFASIDEP
jgi:hypothetical protein